MLRFGPMRSLVLGIEAVLPDGSLFEGLTALKKDNRGYDLRQLLIGAEGTLGVVTAASLRLVPAIGERAVAWVGLDRRRRRCGCSAISRRRWARRSRASSWCRRARSIWCSSICRAPAPPLAGPAPWNVLIEAVAPMSAPGPEPLLYEALRSALETGIVGDAAIAASEAQAEAFWRLRDSISEAEKKDGPAAKHDISVAVDADGGLHDRGGGGGGGALSRHAGQRLRPSRRRQRPFQRPRARRAPAADWVEAEGKAVRPTSTTSSPTPAARSPPSTASAR